MARAYFTNCEHGIRIPISLSLYGESRLASGDCFPAYEFTHKNKKVQVFKDTSWFGEKLHILRGSHKVTDPEEATEIALEIPVEAIRPSTSHLDGEKGNYIIDLRERKARLARLSELPFRVYTDKEDVVIYQNPLSTKLTIYRRVLLEGKKRKKKVRLKSVTSGKEAREILRKAERSPTFATYSL